MCIMWCNLRVAMYALIGLMFLVWFADVITELLGIPWLTVSPSVKLSQDFAAIISPDGQIFKSKRENETLNTDMRIRTTSSNSQTTPATTYRFSIYHTDVLSQTTAESWNKTNNSRHENQTIDVQHSAIETTQNEPGDFKPSTTHTPGYTQHRLWRQFQQWDNFHQPQIGSDVPGHVDRYLIYRCDKGQMSFCGGWGDRLKGVIFTYLIANLTGRLFKAEFLNPECDMSEYMIPNKVNWSRRITEFPKNNSEYLIIRHRNNHELKSRIHKTNFTEEIDPALKYVYFQTNLEHSSGLMKNPLYNKQLSWMHGTNQADIYAAVYKRLFRLSPRLETRLRQVLSHALPSPSHRLICIHVRMGQNPSLRHDTVKRNHVRNLPKVWSFISSKMQTKFDKVFVMSDDDRVIRSARRKFGENLVTVSGKIVHIDQQDRNNDEVMCNGMEKLLVEHHVMMNCDVMVRGHSGLSVLAAAVRGTDDQLYCLRWTGRVEPCHRDEFQDAFL